MIAGIGTDIVKVERAVRAYGRAAFRLRVYTQKEQELIGSRVTRAADNWAVKEAVAKALGTGFGKVLPLEIEVLRDGAGKPYCVLYGQARAQAQAMGVCAWHVSISNEKEYALAFAVGETGINYEICGRRGADEGDRPQDIKGHRD